MANGYSMGMTGGVMPNPMGIVGNTRTATSTMGMTGGTMPAPLAPFVGNLPFSNEPVIFVNEDTPNLVEIQRYPVISRNGAFHIHQDSISGQRYSMTDEFHMRIPQILASRQNRSLTIVTTNTPVIFMSQFDTVALGIGRPDSAPKLTVNGIPVNPPVQTGDSISRYYENDGGLRMSENLSSFNMFNPNQRLNTFIIVNGQISNTQEYGDDVTFYGGTPINTSVRTSIGVIPIPKFQSKLMTINTYTTPSMTFSQKTIDGVNINFNVPINTYNSLK